MTAFLVLDTVFGRIIIVITVLISVFVLYHQGGDPVTALLLVAALGGVAADIARRAVPEREVR